MITVLRSLNGLGWELKIEHENGYAEIRHSTILSTYTVNVTDYDRGAIDAIESMVLALVGTDMNGYEDRISYAIDTALEALANNN